VDESIKVVNRSFNGYLVLMYWTVQWSNPGRGRDFSHPSKPVLGHHPASYAMGSGSFPRGKADGAWRWPPTFI